MKSLKNFSYSYGVNTEFDTDEEYYSQKYEDRDGKSVDAIYTPAISELDKGNIFIEALPRMRSEERLILDSNKDIPNFNHDVLMRKSNYEKLGLLNDLYSIRVTLPIQKNLDALFYNLLSRVYRARDYEITDNIYKDSTDKEWTETLALGKFGEAPPSGFSLLGYAGSGKTSMLQTMFSHYPQVIWHRSGGYTFPQVLYIMCGSNSSTQSDFSSVLNDIGRQVDIAIGNTDFYYYNQISKLANYDKKIGYIKKLINLFNIGVIAIDEIQSLDFNKNQKETYSKLLQITNDTKVAFILCGTEDAYEKMFSSLHMNRRFYPITASSYTRNITFVEMFLRELLKYQWFDKKDVIEIPPFGETNEQFAELVSAMYKYTSGIVAIMVNLYEKINFEYLIRASKPKIDGKFVEKVFSKYFAGMENILNGLDRDFSYAKTKKTLNASNARKQEIMEQMAIKKELDKLTGEDFKNSKELRNDLMNNIMRSVGMVMGNEFTEEQIKTACKTVLARKDALDSTEASLTQDVVKRLNNNKKKKKKEKTTNKDLPEKLANFIGGKQ